VDERALIVKGFNDAWEIEMLKVAKSAVDDPKGIVRRRGAACARFQDER
jgi:hypothetical protein